MKLHIFENKLGIEQQLEFRFNLILLNFSFMAINGEFIEKQKVKIWEIYNFLF